LFCGFPSVGELVHPENLIYLAPLPGHIPVPKQTGIDHGGGASMLSMVQQSIAVTVRQLFSR
jgi:hypothetical protein